MYREAGDKWPGNRYCLMDRTAATQGAEMGTEPLDDRAPLARVSVRLLQTEAVRILREAILDGRLAQGRRLNEIDFAYELGISRGPLREALRILEEEGLVESAPYRGARVVRVSARDLADVLEIRVLMEPFVAVQAVRRSGPLIVERLRALVEDMRAAAEAGDEGGVARAHTAFHGTFYEHSRNRLMARVWQRLEAPVRLYLRSEQAIFQSLEQVAIEHSEVLRLAEAGQYVSLRREMVRHVRVQHRAVMNLVEPETTDDR
jgi:GntR family transcriptional regulator of gluconate operon